MSQTRVPVSTIAPAPGSPAHATGPALPPAPAHLAGGTTGLGALPGASLRVSSVPQRYLLAALIPAGLALLFTLVSLFIRWPAVR